MVEKCIHLQRNHDLRISRFNVVIVDGEWNVQIWIYGDEENDDHDDDFACDWRVKIL